jgi:hypothetical protein
MINPKTGTELKLNIFELKNAAKRTIAIFIVLFATSMVLSNFSGFSYSLRMVFDFLSFFDLKVLISSGRKEKKATSVADIRAEPIRRIIITKKPIMIFKSGLLITIPETGNKNNDV